MTTAIDLSEEEIAELKELTNESEPKAALRVAMTEFLRTARRQKLKTLSGRVSMQDNWRKLEEAELAEDEEDRRVSVD